MPHFIAKNVLLTGFAAESVEAGGEFRILVKARATSEKSEFYLYAEQIANIVFPKIGIINVSIDRLLIVIHPNNDADVYINDFQETMKVKVNKDVAAGEFVMASSVDDIAGVSFPNVTISKDDRIVYLTRAGWRFGIFFDFTSEIETEKLSEDIGKLKSDLLLKNILQTIQSDISSNGVYDAFVITEGKTDWRHLKKAFSKIPYMRLLKYEESEKDRGDTDLLRICENLCLAPTAKPTICIFDNDNEKIIKDLESRTKSGEKFQDWGNGVYSMLIPIPPSREKYKYVSIEMYYSDDVIRKMNTAGKRLFFDNELRKEILPGKSIRKVAISPVSEQELTKKVDSEDVSSIEDESGNKVGLSKTGFAESVESEAIPLDKGDFDNFELIAEIIEDIMSKK